MWFRKAFSALACVSGLTFALACSSDEQDNSAVPSSSVSSQDLNTFRARISAAASSHFDESLRATKDLSSMIDLFAKDPSAANLALARSAWSRSLFDLEQAMAFAFPSSTLDSEGKNEALLVIGPSYNSSDIEDIIIDKVKYPGITSGILKSVNAAEGGHEIMGYNAVEYLLFNSDDLDQWQDKRRLEYLQAVVSVLVDVATDANNDWVEGGPQKEMLFSETEEQTRSRYANTLLRQIDRILIRSETFAADKDHTHSLGGVSGWFHAVQGASVHGLSNLLFSAAPSEPIGYASIRRTASHSSSLSVAPGLDEIARDDSLETVKNSNQAVSKFLDLFEDVHHAEMRLHYAGASKAICASLVGELNYLGNPVPVSEDLIAHLEEIGISLDNPTTVESLQACVKKASSEEFFVPFVDDTVTSLNALRDYLRGEKQGSNELRGGTYYSTETVEDPTVHSDIAFAAILLL